MTEQNANDMETGKPRALDLREFRDAITKLHDTWLYAQQTKKFDVSADEIGKLIGPIMQKAGLRAFVAPWETDDFDNVDVGGVVLFWADADYISLEEVADFSDDLLSLLETVSQEDRHVAGHLDEMLQEPALEYGLANQDYPSYGCAVWELLPDGSVTLRKVDTTIVRDVGSYEDEHYLDHEPVDDENY